tara:strand:- start:269 stop:691 length:423 start_codon:yes stop_codon:yes gene_type:complete
MKKLNQICVIIFGLCLLFLCSCSVYNSKTSTAEQAINTNNKVKIHTVDQSVYKFKELEIKENVLIGITKKNSKTAQKYPAKTAVMDIDKNLVGISLDIQNINEIYTKNKTVSTILSIGIPVIVTFVAFLVLVATSLPVSY